jgi:hypothetical protein
MIDDPMLNDVCAVAALVGLVMILIGRIILFFEVKYLPLGWKLAARFLPLGDLLTLSRFWDTAKKGAFIAMAGMLLLLPFAGLQMSRYDRQKSAGYAERMTAVQKQLVFQQMKEEHLNGVENKQAKCNKLNTLLNTWYQSLQTRRATVTKPQMADFNKEAAAYAAFRTVVNEETAGLAKLRNESFEFSDMKDADFDAFVKKKMRKMKPADENSDPDSD